MMHPTYQLNDAELIHAFQQGQERALELLVLRHKDKIYTTIFMLVKDKYLAEDLFQETFLKIIKTIKNNRYAEQGKFLPWAVRVAHNLCMDHFRKVRIQMPVVNEEGQEISGLFSQAVADIVDPLERKQSHASIRQLIEALAEDQREVIVLRIYADLSFKQIAELTGVSINTALGRMRYALINLRKMIDQKQMVLR